MINKWCGYSNSMLYGNINLDCITYHILKDEFNIILYNFKGAAIWIL